MWRRLLARIWGDHGHWSYTTVVATRGTTTAKAEPKPARTPAAEFNAHMICRKLGHTVHAGWCRICYELVGDLTVDDVVPPKVGS